MNLALNSMYVVYTALLYYMTRSPTPITKAY